LSPVALLALIKHPLARLGAAEGAHARAIAALERAVLRGPRPRPGIGGLAHPLTPLRAAPPETRRGGRFRTAPPPPAPPPLRSRRSPAQPHAARPPPAPPPSPRGGAAPPRRPMAFPPRPSPRLRRCPAVSPPR